MPSLAIFPRSASADADLGKIAKDGIAGFGDHIDDLRFDGSHLLGEIYELEQTVIVAVSRIHELVIDVRE